MSRSFSRIERRRFLRLPMAINVYYKALEDTLDTTGLKHSRAKNLSPGGILFLSSFRLKLGTVIQMMLEFAPRGRIRRIPVLAEVAYCRQLKRNLFEIGAGFKDIFPKDLEFLSSLSSKAKNKSRRKSRP